MMDDSPWCFSGTCKYCDAARKPDPLSRGLYAIVYNDNGATAAEVTAARAWLSAHGIVPE